MQRSPFRRVRLPDTVPGRLFLTSMPGYYGEIEAHIDCWQPLTTDGDAYVLCLAGQAERERKSPDYDSFIAAAGLGYRWLEFPIPDMSIPSDPAAFSDLLDRLHGILSEPKGTLVIHCAAGVGRTGTVATALLVRLGIAPGEALVVVKEAGSEPETREQRRFAVHTKKTRGAPPGSF